MITMPLRGEAAACLVLLLVCVFVSPTRAQEHLNGVVVSDHSWATRAGMDMLEQGGNAVDAAVATAFALAVLDPASSGLGGGGFMVVYEAEVKKAHVLDFLELSPRASRLEMYETDGRLEPDKIRSGGLAVAVPGTVAGLLEALKRFGSLPLEVVMASAVRYAESGFPVTSRLRRAVEKNRRALDGDADFHRIFIGKDGKPYDVGEAIRQPELAESLKRIAKQGAQVFYQGTIGQAISATVKEAGGVLDLDDLKSYKAVWRRPIIGDYRGTVVITVPPASSGGIALVEALNVMEGYTLSQFSHNSAPYLHLLAEVLKVVAADQRQYAGDPGFAQIPVQRLTSKEHAAALRKQISTARAGSVEALRTALYLDGHGGTNHLGVLDGDGNVVAMGLTINDPFGAKLLVRESGIILNNSMARFTVPVGGEKGGERLPNSLEPGKRPATRMMPTILLQGDERVLVVGASGGPRITSAVLQTILNALDFGMSLEKAISSPRLDIETDAEPVVVVEESVGEKVLAGLTAKGHTVHEENSLGVVQAIRVEGPAIAGQSDPRLGIE